jgi:tRNA(adenine34) deaminase
MATSPLLAGDVVETGGQLAERSSTEGGPSATTCPGAGRPPPQPVSTVRTSAVRTTRVAIGPFVQRRRTVVLLCVAPSNRPDGPSAARTSDRIAPRLGDLFDDLVEDSCRRPNYGARVLTDEEAMTEALAEAALASGHGDVPIGAVVVRDGDIIARRHNERELTGDPTAHAEILAIRDAATVVGGWRLDGTTLVVTLEPCAMCAGALVASRVARLVFGAPDPKAGACGSLYNLCVDPRLNHELPVTPGLLGERSTALLEAFFAGLRRRTVS